MCIRDRSRTGKGHRQICRGRDHRCWANESCTADIRTRSERRISSVTQPTTSPTWATVARCAVSGQRIDTTCSGERSGVTPAARRHNPRSCLEGGLGAPAGRGIRLRDEGTGAFSPPGAVMLSPVLVTAPSPAAPRAGAGSHPLSTTFFCTAMADSRMMAPIRVRMTAPGLSLIHI